MVNEDNLILQKKLNEAYGSKPTSEEKKHQIYAKKSALRLIKALLRSA